MTTRTYDVSNRALSSVSTCAGRPSETVSWTYDNAASGNYGKNRVATMSDPSGSTPYAYEHRGLLRSEAKTISGTAFTTKHTYNLDGAKQTITYPSTRVVTYTLDYADRPTSLAIGTKTYASGVTYLPFGPETSVTLGNGAVRTVTFDQRYQMTENKLVKGSTVADYVYTVNPGGNITGIQDVPAAGYTRTFTYDDLNRLKTANTGASLWGTGSYNYDLMGNMTSKNLAGATPRTATFSYVGTTPKVSTATENGALRSVSYDAAGNESGYIASRSYSARNYLSHIQMPRGTSTYQYDFTYDGRGVRTRSSEGNVGGTQAWRNYFYTPELNFLSITNPSATTIQYDILWLNGRPIAQELGGSGKNTARYTFTDHLGTPILQMDSTAVTWRVEYEPFGNVYSYRTGTSALPQPLRFPGQEKMFSDENSEESYNIFRWYRSGWGRYTQADPLGVAYGALSEGAQQPFAYVSDRPTRMRDPLGLFELSDSCRTCSGKPSGAPTGSKDRYGYVHQSIEAACRERLSKIVNVNLRRCVGRSCNSGSVTCINSCPPQRLGIGDPLTGAILSIFGGAIREAKLCVNNWNDLMNAPEGGIGGVVVHEWAHGCGWFHGKGGSGVPGEDGTF